MFSRFWRDAFYSSLLLLLLPGIVGVGAPTIPVSNPGQNTLAAAGVLPDASADRVLGQWSFDNNGYGTSPWLMWLPAGVAIAPDSAPNAGRIFVVEYGYSDDTGNYGNHRVLSWSSAYTFITDQAADLVIGQSDFITRGGGLGKNRFFGPEAAVVDASGNLWVADTVNNRVLRFDYPLSDGMDASVVLGQPDFDQNLPNQKDPNLGDLTPEANTLYYPRGLAMDGAGNLYVADDDNNRVLRFSPPFTDNMDASLVIGQADYTSGEANRGLTSADQNTLNGPKGIAIDAAGNLYVAEFYNNRVTRFEPPLSRGMNASGLFGQPDYTTTDDNTGGVGPGSLLHPVDIAVSAAGDRLFVTDQGNVRLLGYYNPLSDSVADQVYGQPDFYTDPPNSGVSQTTIAGEPLGVAVDSNGSLYFADYQNNRLLAFDVKVVGDGTAGSCTEAALDAALAVGGTIALNCDQTQIDLSNYKSIIANTTIGGIGAVTLSGRNANQLFYVSPGFSLDLYNINLTGGYSTGDGGAISSEGALTLENTTIRDSMAAASGGAIVSYGPLTIRDSLLEGNQALNGGALFPRWSAAQTTIVNSVLRDNHATDTTDGWGGAILSWDGAQVSIEGSDIYSNTARDGGGIYNFANSSLVLYGNTRLRDNTADNNGGGIYNAGGVALVDTTLSGNSANDGGGLNNDAGTAWLTNVTINGNSADYGGGIINYATLDLTNVTISGNTATSYGGGLRNYEVATLTNATLSNNSAPSGGGISMFGGTATLKNSIVAYSPQGGNCGGSPLTNDNSDRYSLSSDNTCAMAGTGSMNGVDPLLMDLGDYGGPTQVHMLRPGSPAVDGVVGSDAPDTDQRGVARPQGNGFDIGAVELAESDFVKKVYLPLVIN